MRCGGKRRLERLAGPCMCLSVSPRAYLGHGLSVSRFAHTLVGTLVLLFFPTRAWFLDCGLLLRQTLPVCPTLLLWRLNPTSL